MPNPSRMDRSGLRLRRGIVIVDGDEVKARQVANQIALAAAVEKYPIKKVFTFHTSVASAKSFVSPGSEGVSNHLPNFQAYHVNGDKAFAALHGQDVDLGFPGIVGPLAAALGHEQMGNASALIMLGFIYCGFSAKKLTRLLKLADSAHATAIFCF